MSMPDFISIVLKLSLLNKWSINVPFVLVNLVGNAIIGIRLCASNHVVRIHSNLLLRMYPDN